MWEMVSNTNIRKWPKKDFSIIVQVRTGSKRLPGKVLMKYPEKKKEKENEEEIELRTADIGSDADADAHADSDADSDFILADPDDKLP